jgi:uncharacterized membrane protein
MSYLVAHVTVLIVFGVIDAGWLSTMGQPQSRTPAAPVNAPACPA